MFVVLIDKILQLADLAQLSLGMGLFSSCIAKFYHVLVVGLKEEKLDVINMYG